MTKKIVITVLCIVLILFVVNGVTALSQARLLDFEGSGISVEESSEKSEEESSTWVGCVTVVWKRGYMFCTIFSYHETERK